jgi:hypothetical protein
MLRSEIAHTDSAEEDTAKQYGGLNSILQPCLCEAIFANKRRLGLNDLLFSKPLKAIDLRLIGGEHVDFATAFHDKLRK